VTSSTEEKTVGDLREEAVRVLLQRLIRSASNGNSDATKLRELAQAVALLEN
jgi:hypothetical protein